MSPFEVKSNREHLFLNLDAIICDNFVKKLMAFMNWFCFSFCNRLASASPDSINKQLVWLPAVQCCNAYH